MGCREELFKQKHIFQDVHATGRELLSIILSLQTECPRGPRAWVSENFNNVSLCDNLPSYRVSPIVVPGGLLQPWFKGWRDSRLFSETNQGDDSGHTLSVL